MSDITRILTAIEQGDARAADKLLPLVYEQLRQMADRARLKFEPVGSDLFISVSSFDAAGL